MRAMQPLLQRLTEIAIHWRRLIGLARNAYRPELALHARPRSEMARQASPERRLTALWPDARSGIRGGAGAVPDYSATAQSSRRMNKSDIRDWPLGGNECRIL